MNKEITVIDLFKRIEKHEDIKAGTILIFTSTIDTTNKIEVEVARKPQGLILYKRNTIDDILPSSWLLNSKIEVLGDNTEEIEELPNELLNELDLKHFNKINELVKAVNQIRKDLNK